MIEVIKPKNEAHWLELRTNDITSTEVSALFGLSPYQTVFEVWHRKKDKVSVQLEMNERMKWGTRLQDSIAAGIAEDNGWEVYRIDEYMRNPELRMGSSFDFGIGDDGILEIKNVDSLVFKDGWLIDGDNLEAPPHIELQVQHQLSVSKRKFTYIGVLVGGNRIALVKREPDATIINAIHERVEAFWHSIETNDAPLPEWSKDADFISKLYGYAEPGKVLEVGEESPFLPLVNDYRALGESLKEIESKRDGIKAQLLTMMGDAEKIVGGRWSISAGMVGPAEISYKRDGFRQFRVNWKKEKKA
jgi:putative phage-type endonuclease